MTLGTLTFHSQTNYGGVLQTWALQEALVDLGFPDTMVVDRWVDPRNGSLRGAQVYYRLRDWVIRCFRLAFLLGDWALISRHARTVRFLSHYLRRTPYHFMTWREAVDAGYALPDCLVVGSDQVWHAGRFGDPRVYLLQDAPPVKAIAYAASFGFTEMQAAELEGATHVGHWCNPIPLAPGETLGQMFRVGLAKFSAISCREAEGVRVARYFGVKDAVHVVDPTLLAPTKIWEPFRPRRPNRRKRLFVYVLGESIEATLDKLDAFAAKNDWEADVFVSGPHPTWYGPLPRNGRTLAAWWRALCFRHRRRVRLRVSAGPAEFLRAIAGADGVVSDSFHALMFSIIYGRNVRMLRPSNEGRRVMFARIAEFADHAHGALLADGLDAALTSVVSDADPVFDAQWLAERRAYSASWLKQAIGQTVEDQ